MKNSFLECMLNHPFRDYVKAKTLDAQTVQNVENVIAADFYNRMRDAFPPDTEGRDWASIYDREKVEEWVDGIGELYAAINRPIFQALKNEEIILTCGAGYAFSHPRIYADLKTGQLMSE